MAGDSVTRALASACCGVVEDTVAVARAGSAAALRRVADWLDPPPPAVRVIDAIERAEIVLTGDGGGSFGFIIRAEHTEPPP